MKALPFLFMFCSFYSYAQEMKPALKTEAEDKHPTGQNTINDLIWVGKPDLSKSCENKSGISTAESAKELTTLGVKIFSQKKIHDSHPHIEMCGIDKGVKNAYLIQKKDLPKAVQKDFNEIPKDQL